MYTAPTGKAAKLLGLRGKSLGYTLHQVFYSFKNYCKQLKEGNSDSWKFSAVHTLVVDECSLVGVTIFSTMLDTLLENSKLKKIVFLGDVRQLPSIEPGYFLGDLFQTMRIPGCSVELKTNHRSESQLIIDNATLISNMAYPKFDPSRNFTHFPVSEDPDIDLDSQGMILYLS